MGTTFKPRNTRRAKALRNTASPAERLLWTHLSKRKLHGFKFSRQMPIGPYFADFLCREAKLIVELDGDSHDFRVDYDAARDAFLSGEGYRALRFINADVINHLDGVVHAIGEALETAVAAPPPTPPASGRGEDFRRR